MLASAIYFFEVLENGSIPLTHGDWLHGAFFHHLHRLNPSLADELHAAGDSSFPKPFCISPLFSKEFELDGRSTLHAKRGATGWFRIGSLHAELTRSMEALQACDEAWVLRGRSDRLVFRLTAVTTDPDRHAWAGQIDPLQLIAAAELDQREEPDRVWFEFMTPCSGSPGGVGALFPTPHLLFTGLHARGQALLPDGLELPGLDSIEKALAVSAYDLKTEMWNYELHKKRIAGFVGRCELHVDQNSREGERMAIHFLAGLAFYCGIGYGTGWGRGMVRRTGIEKFRYRG